MNLKKPISAAMAAMMTLSVTATPVLAAVEDPPGTATQADEQDADSTLGEQSSAEEDALESSDTSEKSHQDAKVYAFANGSYILTVPESINLHNVEKKDLGSGLYTNDKHCKVNLRGDVRQDQVVVVTVTEPVMQSEGSKDVDATVDTSSKTVWNRDDLFTGATAGEDGSYTEPTGVTTVYPVSAELTPGNWVGTAMFNCSLETTSSIASVVTGIDPSSFDYDGQAHTPTLIFADGSALVEGKDYVISGDTAKSEEGNYTLTVTGTGKYIGSTSFAWNIKKYDISTAVSGLDNTVFEEDETTHAPNITWREGFDLKEGVDYEVSGTASASDAGDYTITITGKGKYKGTIDLEWKVVGKTDIALAVATLSPAHFDYDGENHSPTLVWNEGYENLAEGQDYAISGNISESENGNYTLTVTGKGQYKGECTFKWSIGELIPLNAVYTIKSTGENLVGDQVTVVFPLHAEEEDIYVDDDYTYYYNKQNKNWYSKYIPETLMWRVKVKNTAKTTYAALRDHICDKPLVDMSSTYSGCSKMTVAPDMPDSVKYAEACFGFCSSLKEASHISNCLEDALGCFTYNDNLEIAPVFPETVTILLNTFFRCKNLKTYTNSHDADGDFTNYAIPNSAITMAGTFAYCTSLVKAPEIPASVTELWDTYSGSDGTFLGCTALEIAPNIPDGVTCIYDLFSGCTALRSYIGSADLDDDFSNYVIPNNVTDMGSTFAGCKFLTEAPVIPNSVTDMGSTFSGCKSLIEAPVIPNSVTNMWFTFAGCTSLTEAPVIPDKVTDMTGTFSNCTTLKTYVGNTDSDGNFSRYIIPRSVKKMGDSDIRTATLRTGTFENCSLLTTPPVIPNLVTDISRTFRNCTSLAVAPIIPDSVTNMVGTFDGCVSLKTYVGSNEHDGDFSCYIIPNGVKSMGYCYTGGACGAFKDCVLLTNAPVIPNSVTDIENTFSGCTSLTGSLICNANPNKYKDALKETYIYNIDGTCTEDTKDNLIKTSGKKILSNSTATLDKETIDYDQRSHTPQLMYQNKKLIEGIDYTMSGDVQASECGDYSITITGIGVYAGVVMFNWRITGERTIIPKGGVYTIGDTGECLVGDGQNVLFPNEIGIWDTYDDDYYHYYVNQYDSQFSSWAVSVKSSSLVHYGPLQKYICREPVYDISSTFKDCYEMVESPVIPFGVSSLYHTFDGCTSLVNAPVIPSSVTDMDNAFSGCTSLTGTLICNADPNYYDSALSGTKISTIEGSCSETTKLNLLKSTGRTMFTDDTIELVSDAIKYDGSTHTPQIQYNGIALTLGVDYIVANDFDKTELGEYSTTYTGIGNYVGSISFNWSISTNVISDAIQGLSAVHYDYDGESHTPSLVWNNSFEAFVNGQDYSVSGTQSATDKGNYTITVKGLGEYGGTVSFDWSIGELIPNSAIYTIKSTNKPLTGDGLSVVFPAKAYSGDTYVDDDYKYECSSSGWSVVVKDEAKSAYGVLRSSICDKPLTSLYETFKYCSSMEEAPTIPDSVTNMGYAFSDCSKLAEVPSIPSGVTSMASTFRNCSTLTSSPVIPDTVTNMSNTFCGCTNLTSAPTIPAAVTNLSYVFQNCSALEGTLTCNANPSSYSSALYNTKINVVMGDCSDTTKLNLLKTTGKSVLTNDSTTLVTDVLKYDGSKHIPQIQYNGTILTAGEDYSLSEDTEKTDCGEYIVTVTGIGNYVGQVDLTWYIATNCIGDAVTGLSQTFFEFDGNEHAPAINWNDGFESFAEGQDYSISGTNSATDKGNYTITIKGLGEYKGTISFTWGIGELIPVGAMYTAKSSGVKLIGDGSSVVFPVTASSGDIYEDADYKYTCSSSTWSVVVKDKTQTSYGALRGDIGGKKLTSLKGVFQNCTAMTKSPAIPDTITVLWNAFTGCTALVTAPEIPSSVTDMDNAFSGCTSLTGTLICNANPRYTSSTLKGTKITAIEGSCSDSTKTKLLATR